MSNVVDSIGFIKISRRSVEAFLMEPVVRLAESEYRLSDGLGHVSPCRAVYIADNSPQFPATHAYCMQTNCKVITPQSVMTCKLFLIINNAVIISCELIQFLKNNSNTLFGIY